MDPETLEMIGRSISVLLVTTPAVVGYVYGFKSGKEHARKEEQVANIEAQIYKGQQMYLVTKQSGVQSAYVANNEGMLKSLGQVVQEEKYKIVERFAKYAHK